MQEGKYYIGLDCGTNSVGFAVADTDYRILKHKGKAMWGSHLFDEASTAQSRRMNRTARRRIQRRKERIRLAQEIFAESIADVDPEFFIRLRDSAYVIEDKHENQPNSLFFDKDFTDKEYFKKYPTIYHLRSELLHGEIPDDPRLLYLAIHHILKHRGHFVFPGEDLKATQDLTPVLEMISELHSRIFEGEELIFPSASDMEEILKERKASKRQELLINSLTLNTEAANRKKLLSRAIAGYKVKTGDFFDKKEEYDKLPAIEFKSNAFEDTALPLLNDALDDDEIQLVINCKALYDWSLLSSVLNGNVFISDAKVALYEKNKKDLATLKELFKTYAPNDYDVFFHGNNKTQGYYSNYIGRVHDNGSKRAKRCSDDDFYKAIKKCLDGTPAANDERYQRIKSDMEDSNFLPLLSSYRNGIIPYQINKTEMGIILHNASAKFPWLDKEDADGWTPTKKLISLLTFRIPYYVGPLAKPDEKHSPHSWLTRSEGKIYPWTFNEIVDESASAEEFIRRMTNRCTYFKDEYVLPKNSLLYSKYLVLNELNNLRFNGERLPVAYKQSIYEGLYKTKKKVTKKDIQRFAVQQGWYAEKSALEISGIAEDITASLGSYIDFKPYLESGKLKRSGAEQIIHWLTVFSEGGRMLKEKIQKQYGRVLSKEDIDRISRLKYSGWGRLSKKLLADVYCSSTRTGERMSIISWLWESQNNLQELLLGKGFEMDEPIGDNSRIDKLDYSLVDELYVSPSVKRQIWQTLKVVDEIHHIMGHAPEKVFVEVTRTDEQKGKEGKKKSRKQTILGIYKQNQKKIDENLLKELEGREEAEISNQDKLYLYYSQCGKCIYSGEPIDLDDKSSYDVDHIYPKSKSNDDSLTNRVLVKTKYNRDKSNSYPISDEIRNKMGAFWKYLADMELITKEKYHRLTRCAPLTTEDIEGFINRQLVETSQSVKATADILKRYFGEDTRIVYSKARNVTAFRANFKIPKCRALNDFHHAKDAYLNIVVGNVFDTKYTKEFYKNYSAFNPYYNLSEPFKYNVDGAWSIEKGNETIVTVKKTMERNDVLLTRATYCRKGQLFDLTIESANSDSPLLPKKSNDPVLLEKLANSKDKDKTIREWTNRYGGYNNLAVSYFALVKHKDKKKTCASFIPIRLVDAERLSTKEALLEYCKNTLKLADPEVILEKVRINTHLIINGYSALVTGISSGGASITLRNHSQLFLDQRLERHAQHIEKYMAEKKEKNYTPSPEFFKITKDENIELYTTIATKAVSKPFTLRPGNKGNVLNASLDTFKELDITKQIELLYNLFSYFNGTGRCNLESIGDKKNGGILVCSSKFDLSKTRLKVISHSPTGLYDSVLDVNRMA